MIHKLLRIEDVPVHGILCQSIYLIIIISVIITMNWSEVTQSCPTLCDPMDCSPPGSSVHGILHARILEWVAISFSKGSSRPRDQTQVSHIAGRRFNLWATRDAPIITILPCIFTELQRLSKLNIFYIIFLKFIFEIYLACKTV